MSKHFRIFLQGLVITAPIFLTLYVCVQLFLWLDRATQGLGLAKLGIPVIPGLGVAIVLAGIYVVGLLSGTWVVKMGLRLGEAILERIPGVKSFYSAVRDLLQFLSGSDEKARGVPARVKMLDGKVNMLGLITQKQPETFMGESERGRVAVYLPMSYQIGGFTVLVEPEDVEEIAGMTVEQVLKLSMTAGVGLTKRGSEGG